MAASYQTTFWNASFWMKMFEFWLRFHWNLFLRFELAIFQHWFRQLLGADQATSHYLNQGWSLYWRIHVHASLSLHEFNPNLSTKMFAHDMFLSDLNILKQMLWTNDISRDLCLKCYIAPPTPSNPRIIFLYSHLDLNIHYQDLVIFFGHILSWENPKLWQKGPNRYCVLHIMFVGHAPALYDMFKTRLFNFDKKKMEDSRFSWVAKISAIRELYFFGICKQMQML